MGETRKQQDKKTKWQKLLIICGPTATGKTSLALELARKFGGELISCDSRQVYKFMDVVTGKDVPEEFKSQKSKIKIADVNLNFYSNESVRIWGHDLVAPDQQFDVSLYLEFVSRVLPEIWREGRLPILVGGTGLYLQSAVKQPETVGVPINYELREVLESKSAEELYVLLLKKDPKKAMQMNESDQRNPRRLVRALEVAEYYQAIYSFEAQDVPYSETHPSSTKSRAPLNRGEFSASPLEKNKSDVLWVGLTVEDRQKLYQRIDERVEERLMAERLIEELDYLIEKDYMRFMPAQTIGYQQLIEWMGGEIGFEGMVKRWKFAEHRYARRQLTWFRKRPGIRWFDVEKRGWKKLVVEEVRKWYTR